MPTAETTPRPSPTRARTRANAAARTGQSADAALTVAVYIDQADPTALLRCLAAAPAHLPVEVLVLCDAATPALAQAIALRLERLALPARLIVRPEAVGRARGRNLLCARAHGGHILFLDADLAPDRPGVLEHWLAFLGREAPALAQGGVELPLAPDGRSEALHWSLSRGAPPPCANLLVRTDIARDLPFDETLPDPAVEADWLLRVEARHGLARLHNPVLRHAFEPASRCVARLAAEGAALALLRERHPIALAGARLNPLAGLLRVRRLRWLRPLCRALAVDRLGLAPLVLRRLAARAYRAAHAAEHLA